MTWRDAILMVKLVATWISLSLSDISLNLLKKLRNPKKCVTTDAVNGTRRLNWRIEIRNSGCCVRINS